MALRTRLFEVLPHKSVLLNETISGLNLKKGDVVIDGTLGSGGHSAAILDEIGNDGKLIGIDQDIQAIERCQKKWASQSNISFVHDNFRNMAKIAKRLNIETVNAVLLDIGVSSNQLDEAERGFSFQANARLDMRMNQENPLSAYEMVNSYPEEDLANIIFKYGEERNSRKIARAIVESRSQKNIETTTELADLILDIFDNRTKSQKASRPFYSKKHPATRTFQGLRIAVNDEMGALEEGIQDSWDLIKSGGRLATISFHSLEDRLVKHQYREWKVAGEGFLVTKKPITASEEEIQENSRSRSAKLRIVEKK